MPMPNFVLAFMYFSLPNHCPLNGDSTTLREMRARYSRVGGPVSPKGYTVENLARDLKS
jgi:hypothetical protein